MVAKKKLNDHLLINDDDRDKDDVLIYEEEILLGQNDILQ
jgi:hypothetical protein